MLCYPMIYNAPLNPHFNKYGLSGQVQPLSQYTIISFTPTQIYILALTDLYFLPK